MPIAEKGHYMMGPNNVTAMKDILVESGGLSPRNPLHLPRMYTKTIVST